MFRPRSIGLLLAFVTLLVYLPATSYHFINFDDPDYVADNPVVQNGLTWAGIKWAFDGAHASNWHPLTWLSHMLDCDLFRLNPAGPHLVNILFHAVNTSLLFTLLFRLTAQLWPCVFVAALFAWHPMHVESVAWIAERKDVLSTFFTFLTLLSYTRYVQQNRRQSFWFALFFFTLALLSKPMPVTLPLVMLLLDYWPLTRVESYKLKVAGETGDELSIFNFQFSTILEKWPFYALSAASCVVTFLAQRNTAVSSLAHDPFSFRLENMVVAYAGYLWKMVWPLDLAIFYPLHAPIAWQLIAKLTALLMGISVIVWLERKNNPWLLVGWLWFLITLLPVIGLVQVGSQAMADRYSYFPLIGIFVGVAFSALALAEHFYFLKKCFLPTAILVLGFFLVLTEEQLRYWYDSESLFTHALTVEDSALAHLSLGVALQDQNRLPEAMTQYVLAWRLNPDSDLANGNIARLLDGEGKTKLAVIYYQKAVKIKSQSTGLYESYGVALMKLERFDEAMKAVAVAAQVNPSDPRPQMLMGEIFLKQRNLAEAAKKFSAAAKVDPNSAQPHFLLGRLLLQQEHDVDALKELRAALKRDPDNLEILIFTVSVLAADENSQVRDGAAAHSLADKAMKLTDGQQPAVLDVLAMADAETGQFDEAAKNEQKAIKLVLAGDHKDDAVVMQQRLQLYLKHEPWRESFKKN